MDKPGVVLAGKPRLSCIRYYILFLGLLFFPVLAWSSEAALRAAFVFNFIKFIEWPATNTGNAFHFCAINASGDTREALQNIDGKTVKNYTINVVYLEGNSLAGRELLSCQILYHPLENSAVLPLQLPTGVVLVVDEPVAHTANVSIALWKQHDNRIAFSINDEAVKLAGVAISSQLLKLAQARHKPGARGGE